jgi:uncharacterized protein
MIVQLIDSIHAISRTDWDSIYKTDYPFLRYDFLAALEDSQSVSEKVGWQVAHIAVYDQQNLIAFMPGYCKTHSYGEYVFDWSWADAYRRYNQQYYPKWINAIPFTPCTGPRLLIADNHDVPSITKTITEFLNRTCEEKSWSGWHCLFPDADLHNTLNDLSIPERLGCQFHWFNNQYQSFDDFLSSLNSRKRKSIRKERQAVLDQGFAFRHKSAADLSAEDADNFYKLYRNTYYKRSGHAGYLTQDFFQQLFSNMRDQLLLVEAIKTDSNQLIAASLFVKDSQTIYGRYWGCTEEFPLLHFETCYYQGIDYAIQHQLHRFDGGAQGEHKIPRGFQPCITYSHHWIKDKNFRPAIQHFLNEEAEAVKAYAEEAKGLLPFRQENK